MPDLYGIFGTDTDIDIKEEKIQIPIYRPKYISKIRLQPLDVLDRQTDIHVYIHSFIHGTDPQNAHD